MKRAEIEKLIRQLKQTEIGEEGNSRIWPFDEADGNWRRRKFKNMAVR
jgi:hypothetical protein